MIKVSVIIPVYNVDKYLRRCLDSVIAQTLRNIEIICINDSSPDSSVAILDEYASKYSKTREIIHKRIRAKELSKEDFEKVSE